MVVQRSEGDWSVPPASRSGTGFALAGSVSQNRTETTTDDFVYHVRTSFPQVRPRGFFELCYTDAHWRSCEESRRPHRDSLENQAQLGWEYREMARPAEGILAFAASNPQLDQNSA